MMAWSARRLGRGVAWLLALTLAACAWGRAPAAAGAGETAAPPPVATPVPAPPAAPAVPGGTLYDVTYCHAGGVALKLDLYQAGGSGSSARSAPLAVFIHGGGWTAGDKADGGGGALEIAELGARGYVVAVPNYRLAPEARFPAQIEDVKCAVRFLRANAAAYGIDPARVVAWGESAGGHLAALLGLAGPSAGFDHGEWEGQPSAVQAVATLYPATDLSYIASYLPISQGVFGAAPDQPGPALSRASPVSYVTSSAPPFLLLHGERDTQVPTEQSRELYAKLTAAGVTARLVLVKNADHFFEPAGGPIAPSRAEITRLIAGFFDDALGRASAGQITMVSRSVAVPPPSPAAPSLDLSATSSGSALAARAVLRDAAGQPAAGKLLAFGAGSVAVAALTDASGVASATLALPPGSYTLTVYWGGDAGVPTARATQAVVVR